MRLVRGSSQIGWVSTGAEPTLTATVTGKAMKGSTLTCAASLDTVWSHQRLRYTWLRNGREIRGETSRRYAVTRRDVGADLRCGVSVTLTPVYTQLGADSRAVAVRS